MIKGDRIFMTQADLDRVFPVVNPPTMTIMDLQIQLRENIKDYANALLAAPPVDATLHRSMSREQVIAAYQSIRSYMEECGKLLAREYAKLPPRAVFIVDPNKLEEPSAD